LRSHGRAPAASPMTGVMDKTLRPRNRFLPAHAGQSNLPSSSSH
jgi:hypothetical protein